MENPIKYSDLIAPDSSITDLIKQLQDLSVQYSNSINDIKKQAEQLKNALSGVSGATEQGRQVTKQAVDETAKLEQAQKKLAEAESKNNQELQRLKQATTEANRLAKLQAQLANSAEGSYNKLSAQYSINKIKLNQMSEAMRKNTQDGQKLEKETKAIYEEMKRLQEATGKHQLNVGNYKEASDAIIAYGNSLKGTLGLNSNFANSLMALGKSGVDAKGALAGLGDGFKALGSTLMGLMSNPVFLAIAGIAGVGAGFKWWYDYNSGLVEATRLTREFAGVTGEELVELRTYVQAVADTWGHDFKETMQAVDAVAANFGISFNEAIQAIKDGFVAGADLNGDFLSKLQQYPAYFKEAGLSVRQFIAILTQTRSGIFGDKGLDAIKQANARIREMSTATADTLKNLGFNVEELQQKMESGALTTFDVLQMVSARLSELPETSQLVGETLMDVFGKQGRDAGLEMIKSLADIETNLDIVKQGTAEFGQMEEEQMNAQMELQKALATLFDNTGGSFEKMKSDLKIFATKALTQVINGIIDVTNWFIRLYNKSTVVRAGFYAFAETLVTAFKIVGNVLSGVVEMIKGVGNAIGGLLSFDASQIATGLKQVLQGQAQITVQNVRTAFQYGYNMTHWNGGQQLQEIGQSSGGSGSGGGLQRHGYSGAIEDQRGNHGYSGNIEDRRGRHGYTGNIEDRRNENPNQIASGIINDQMAEYDNRTRTNTSSSGGNERTPYRYQTNYTPTPKPVVKRGRTETPEQRAQRLKHEEEERIRKEEEAYKRSIKIRRDYEDAQLKVQYTGTELRRQQLMLEYDRLAEDLKHQLQVEDKILTAEDKQNIKARIEAIGELREQGLARLEEEENRIREEERIKKEREKIEDLKDEKDAIQLRLDTVKEGSEEELALLQKKIDKEQEIALAENRINGSPLAEADVIAKYDKERAKAIERYHQAQLELFDKRQEAEEAEFNIIQHSERKKTEFRLKQEKARLEMILKLNETALEKLSDDEIRTIKANIASIDNLLGGSGSETHYRDLYDVMGLDISEDKKEALNQSLQYAQEAVNTFMQSYVQSAQQKAQLSDQAVEDSKRVLEAEMTAKANGYASNVEWAQKELENSKKMQEQAHRQAVRAQKEQELLDTAMQASSLITATANIWKTFTGAGIFGVPMAIAATALMWGSFTASKIRALSLKTDEQYGEGTVELLQGGSHQSGNDVDLGRKPDGTRRRAEGGEYFAVINKRNSRRFRKLIPSVIGSLNDGTFPQKYMNAYATDDAMVFNVNSSSPDLRALNDNVKAIRQQNEKRIYTDANGNITIVYNNLKRTIKR